MPLRILGVDPGYATIGFGVIDSVSLRFTPVDFGAITTDPALPFEQRLCDIYDGMKYLLEKHNPQAVALEELFFTNNRTTGIGVAQARGVILLAVRQAGLSVCSYTPPQVKQAVVGYGNAEKRQVMEMTRQLLHLKEVPRPDDAADALALAIAHAHSAGSRLGSVKLLEQRLKSVPASANYQRMVAQALEKEKKKK